LGLEDLYKLSEFKNELCHILPELRWVVFSAWRFLTNPVAVVLPIGRHCLKRHPVEASCGYLSSTSGLKKKC